MYSSPSGAGAGAATAACGLWAIWAITHEREMTEWAFRYSSDADAFISEEMTLSR